MMNTDGWTEITEEQYRALQARFARQEAERNAKAAVARAYSCVAASYGAEYSGHSCDACRVVSSLAKKAA